MSASDHHDHEHHGHDHDDHDHGGHHHHHHGDASPLPPGRRLARALIALAVVAGAIAAASFDVVPAGSAAVVSRLGAPTRVQLEPGALWRLPTPLERIVAVDRRLQTTVGGQHGVLTSDGLSLVTQAYIAWRVRGDAESVLRFVRAAGNDPDVAGEHLRTLLGSALETITGRFAATDLVNADASRIKLDAYESALRERLAQQAEATYGIEVVQVGLQRLMLPESTVEATTDRMIAERETLAEERKARGREQAGEIRSAADKEVRLARAEAEERAAKTVADAKAQAAAILAEARTKDPRLYEYMRSLDMLDATLGTSTRLVLRSDAAPFRALVDGPPVASPTPSPAAEPAR